MNTNRIISIILSDLSLENLKLQDTIEKSINSNENIDTKIFDVKSTLKNLVLNELMIGKFQSLISTINNNQTQNQNENGQV